jgi:hypothetical protein
MFSFGFQKAFQRGFEADDEVFFTKVRIFDMRCQPKLMPTGHFKEPGKRQDCRHGARRFFGADGLHTFRTRRCVNHMLPCCRYS